MSQHLTETTQLKCDKGTAPAPLSVTSQSFMQIEGKLQATEEDKQPHVNIKPFGVCSITRMSCNPAPVKWQNTSVFEIDGKKELLDNSTCQCAVGGKISPIKSAQTFVEEGGESIYQPIVYDYDKKEDEDNPDEEINDYQLYKDGTIKPLKDRSKSEDRLFASNKTGGIEKEKKIIIKKENKNDKTIISQLQFDANKKGGEYLASLKVGEGDTSIGKTQNVTDVVNLYNFMNKNTDSNIEIGLFKYNEIGGISYLIATQHRPNALKI